MRGGFDLLLGDALGGVLVVTRPAAAPVRFTLNAGDCGTLALP